jgi:ABC-type multidrug transport system fused ATPase/permease subunit
MKILKKYRIISWVDRVRNLGLSYRVIIILSLLSLVATITEIISIGIFLPIFQFIRLDGDITALVSDSTLWKYLINVFDFFKIKPLFISLLLISFSFFIARQFLLYVRLVYGSAVRQRIMQALRHRIFKGYIEADTTYHDNTPVGSLVNVVTTEVNKAIFGMMAPLELIVYFIMLIGYLAILALLSWQMTLLSAIVLLLSSRIPHIWIKKSANTGRSIVSANTLVSEFLVGRFRSPRLVRLAGTEVAEKNEFHQLTQLQRKHSVFASILQAKSDVVMEPIVIGLSLIFLYFSYTVLKLQIEIIGLYLLIVLRMLPIVKGIISQQQKMQNLLGPIEVIEERLSSMKDSVEKDLGVKSIRQLNKSFLLDNVSYRYPSSDYDALKEVTINISVNKITAIVGPSGSGKSTLIDLLPRLRMPNKGSIKIDDIDIGKYTLKSLRKSISYAPQSPQIFDGTVKNHILYGKINATEEEVQEAIRLAGAEDFINKLPLGLDTILGEDAIKLSGGQRQRLDLARALVRKASILILDEPTSNLDIESEQLFNQVLYRIRKETNTTIIIVSHRLSSISDADNIVVLNQGKIESSGTHLELLSQNGWYAKVWKMQA